jgi:hypothetical protein
MLVMGTFCRLLFFIGYDTCSQSSSFVADGVLHDPYRCFLSMMGINHLLLVINVFS